MPSPAYLAQPNIQRLPSLLREIQAGEIRIPRFQRPFVWTDEQRLDLFRSIYDGIPIGSILIWRTKDNALRCYDHLGRRRLGWSVREEEAEGGQVRQYVLDGHQRLTTLFDALGGALVTGDMETEATSDEEDWQGDAIRPIYFDLAERSFRVQRKPGELPDKWLPLSILLDPYKLFEFQKRHLETGVDRRLVNRAESLASTFKDYFIPVVPIVTEDLELATQSFQRANSGGTPMTEVHMVSALTWSPDFDLNERIQEILTELGEVGWQDLEEKMVLNTCKAALELDVYDADAKEIRDALKNKPEILEEATVALKKATIFLREHCNVHGPAVLPYSFQLVLLADAMRLVKEPSPETETALTRWFWLTTYSEHFGGISAGRLAKTLAHLRAVVTHSESPEPPELSRNVRTLPRFDFRTARSRAIALRLAELSPQNGGPERHDPFQLLADYGRDAMPMLLPSREVATQAGGPENRILVHPKEANQLRRKIREAASEHRDLLNSHAISENAAFYLELCEWVDFLKLRREELISLERAFVEQLGLSYTGD
jgi:hypothetical protein